MTLLGRAAGVGAALLAAVSVTVWTFGAPTPPAAGGPLSGAALFQAKGCAACHTGPHSVAPFDTFPELDDAPAWAADRRPGMTAAEYVTESIRVPGAFLSPVYVSDGGPTSAMPDLALNDAEIDALVGYLLHTD